MPSACHFELVAVTSVDGFIARYSGENITQWTSPEEQDRFQACFAGVDWSLMGRITHHQAFKPDRRRIVFSRSADRPEWRTDNHLWLDPATCDLGTMLMLAGQRHPAKRNLILGGTAVHEWFMTQGRIDRIQLAIEPVRFGAGLPLFSDQRGQEPVAYLQGRGFRLTASERLNAGGTIWHTLDAA